MPSEFFGSKGKFSDGSPNIYQATKNFLRNFHSRDVVSSGSLKLDTTQIETVAREIMTLCENDEPRANHLLTLAVWEDKRLGERAALIRDQIKKLAMVLSKKEVQIEEQAINCNLVPLLSKKLNSPVVNTGSLGEYGRASTVQMSKILEEMIKDKDFKILVDKVEKALLSADDAPYVKLMEEIHSANPKQVKQFLLAVKYVDNDYILHPQKSPKEFHKSTYELRHICCKVSKGEITTAEAFTFSLDPNLYNDRKRLAHYLTEEKHFVPERQQKHYLVLLDSTVEMMNMSRRYNDDIPTTYAVRGNTASGKSFACSSHKQFKEGLLDGQPVGALNPDTVKTALRIGIEGITDEQVHAEGAAISGKLTVELKNKAIKSSLVLDERLAEGSKIDDLLLITDKKKGELKLLDLEVPFIISCCRVLRRNISKDPCVPFGPIAAGFQAIRKYREEVLKKVESDLLITSYRLMAFDPNTHGLVEAARKEGDKFTVINKDLYEASKKPVSETDIKDIGKRLINDDLIAEMYALIPREKWDHLKKYIGKTLEQALNEKSLEIPK